MVKSVYLIGKVLDKLGGKKLPSLKEVMSVLFYYLDKKTCSFNESLSITIDKVFEIWCVAGIPTREKRSAFLKLTSNHNRWRNLQKNSKKKSKAQKKKESVFRTELNKLFDIAHADIFNKLDNEKRLFYLGQKSSSRRGFISYNPQPTPKDVENMDVDVSNDIHNNNSDNREENIDNGNNNTVSFDVGVFDNDNSDNCCAVEINDVASREIFGQTSKLSQKSLDSNTSRLISDYEDETPKEQVPKINIMTSELAAALDRANVSSRMATYIIAALLSSLNIDCASVNFSHLTIHRAREKFRKETTLNLKTNLETDNYVLHFDGKLLSDITGTEQVDRLPIILSSSGKFQLIGVPKLESGTGKNQASAIIKTVKQWNISTDNIKALCSDTTASNTGKRL